MLTQTTDLMRSATSQGGSDRSSGRLVFIMSTPQSRNTTQVSKEEGACFEQDFTVVTYNILADFYLEPALVRGKHQNCLKQHVTPHNNTGCPRHKLLLAEVRRKS